MIDMIKNLNRFKWERTKSIYCFGCERKINNRWVHKTKSVYCKKCIKEINRAKD